MPQKLGITLQFTTPTLGPGHQECRASFLLLLLSVTSAFDEGMEMRLEPFQSPPKRSIRPCEALGQLRYVGYIKPNIVEQVATIGSYGRREGAARCRGLSQEERRGIGVVEEGLLLSGN